MAETFHPPNRSRRMALAIPDTQFNAMIDQVTEGMNAAVRTQYRVDIKAFRDAIAAHYNTVGVEDPAAIASVNEDLIDRARDDESRLKAAA